MPDSPQGKMIQDLLRLNATRIQVVSTPTTRRLPIHFFDYVVRATFILYNDDSRAVEVEKLDEMQFPRQRFTKPVRIGIFVCGHPRPEPGLEQHDEQHQHAPAIMPGLPTDIDFPGVSAGITQEVKSAVARLHLNMGHPSKEELCRMMAQQMRRLNALANSDVRHVNAYDHHKHQDHLQPPSHSCQFGDEIQMDVVYCRTLRRTTIMILGAVDRARGFYQAALLPDRNASATFETFEQMWLKPYGLPLRVTCGPDTSFKGDFQLRLQALGVSVEHCPPEAHYVIGAVERRNAVFRLILGKLIDPFGAQEVEQCPALIMATCHALNSGIRTHGRSAYQAVFGREPRLPDSIFNDPMTLSSSTPIAQMENYDPTFKAEVIRAEALKTLHDLDTSQHLRRLLCWQTSMDQNRFYNNLGDS